MQYNSSGHVVAARPKWLAIFAALALAIAINAFVLPSAQAAGSFEIYDEDDSPNPLNATNGLVFYKAADLGWVLNGEDGVPLDELESLAYTVTSSTSYAPSFQLITSSDQFSYARLVWEPYQQSPAQGPNEGAFADLQDGVWWTNKIASGDGSQSSPQPLAFFADGGGAGWTNVKVGAIDIHQGTTTDSTSLVTKVVYGGNAIPLGDADSTPFDQDDIDTAVDSAVTSAVDAYKANHHTADGTNLGESRLTLSKAPRVGKTIGLTKSGSLAKATNLKYQWFVAGDPVKNATKSTFKVPASARKHNVSAHVTGTYKYMVFTVHSNSAIAK